MHAQHLYTGKVQDLMKGDLTWDITCLGNKERTCLFIGKIGSTEIPLLIIRLSITTREEEGVQIPLLTKIKN